MTDAYEIHQYYRVTLKKLDAEAAPDVDGHHSQELLLDYFDLDAQRLNFGLYI
jgi:hypothetical protein